MSTVQFFAESKNGSFFVNDAKKFTVDLNCLVHWLSYFTYCVSCNQLISWFDLLVACDYVLFCDTFVSTVVDVNG